MLYNRFWSDKMWGLDNNIFDKCPVSNCYVTNDASLLETSDVVLFHIPNLQMKRFPYYERPPNQRWVFFMLESEAYTNNMAYTSHPWKAAFNWTMTYRPDSDITMYYGEIEEREDIFPKNHLAIAKSKTKSVAWLVSHCNTVSRRDQYVAELAKHIPVDIYGDCGNLTCSSRSKYHDPGCYGMLNSTYLFYLSFENSLCPDYVTEKLFKILEMDLVPVVRGGIGQEYSRITRGNRWYIDSNEFKSPKALAQYLLYLKEHPEEYVEYFNNKNKFKVTTRYGTNTTQWCKLCAKLNDCTEPEKIITNINMWWNVSNCVFPKSP